VRYNIHAAFILAVCIIAVTSARARKSLSCHECDDFLSAGTSLLERLSFAADEEIARNRLLRLEERIRVLQVVVLASSSEIENSLSRSRWLSNFWSRAVVPVLSRTPVLC